MSKKTIPFKMPAGEPRSEQALNGGAVTLDESGGSAPEAGGITQAADADRWVREREVEPTRTFSPLAAAPRLMLDLAAERGLPQVLALSLLTPSMLGWYWAAHAMKRYARLWDAAS